MKVDTVETFANRLRQGLDMRGMKPAELSARTGISKSSISHYLKGDWKAKQDSVYSIARVLDVSEAWLMGYNIRPERQHMSDSKESTTAPSVVKSHAEQKPSNGRRIIPLVGNIACGLPILAEENIESMIELPDGSKQCDFALRCRGDSMVEIGICDGDIAYIRKQPQVENGEIAAVRIGDEATLKKIRFEGNQIALYAANRDLYPFPQIYSGEQLADVHIEGKLVGYTHWD